MENGLQFEVYLHGLEWPAHRAALHLCTVGGWASPYIGFHVLLSQAGSWVHTQEIGYL